MAHDVFISHSAKDKTTADAVCAMLESEGIRCWIAPRDVTPGMEWGECIIDAIEQTRIMVLVFTADANASPQIRREVERAVNRGVAILPVRMEDVLPAKALEYFIGNVHWLDALTPPLEAHLKGLAGTIRVLLARMKAPEEQPPAALGSVAAAVPLPSHPANARQNASAVEPAASAPKTGGQAAASGAAAGFHFWGIRAWTWAGGAVSLLLLAVVFVVVHSTSRSAPNGATQPPVGSAPEPAPAPPPQVASEPSPPPGAGSNQPSKPGFRVGAKPQPQVKSGRAPTNAPAPSPPAASPASDELQAGQLMQAKNYTAALPLAQSACAGGNMTGCNMLGLLYRNGWGVAQNYAQALALFQQACNGGEVSGCGNLGYFYVKGLGVPQNVPRGIALLQRACNAGRQWSCQQLQQLQR